jgi:hypothetical protein
LVPVPEFHPAFLYPDAAVIELPRWHGQRWAGIGRVRDVGGDLSTGLAQPPEAVAAETDLLAWAVRRVGVTEHLPHSLPLTRLLRAVRQPDLGGLG